MPIVETVPISNFSEIVCLSMLSASLMKIQSKMNSLSSGQHFPYDMSIGDLRANPASILRKSTSGRHRPVSYLDIDLRRMLTGNNSHVNHPIYPKIEIVQDFIAA